MVIEATITTIGIVGLALWLRFRSSKVKEPLIDSGEPSPSHDSQGDHSLASPEILGHYRLVAYLGEGGMAQVYRAEKDSAPFALKLIREEFAEDAEFQKRFRREIAVCKDLSHPNIVSLLDWGEEGGMLYLVLEYIEGRELSEVIDDGPLGLLEAQSYIQGLIDGLVYAHERGVVHRDLKPSNIMVTESKVVKIMDFGLARNADGDKVTKTGDSMGTPAYLPPEQITGALPNPKADQYALGVILYEMLAGRRPFEEKNPLKMMMKHLQEVPPDPLEFNPELHPLAAKILLRMLEKSPESRFGTLLEVKEGFKALAQGQPWEMPKANTLEVRNEAPSVKVDFTSEPPDNDETAGFQVSS